MALSLYNTLTRRVEPFTPLVPPRVTLYTCGPTVWNYAHLGNFRTFLFEDLLRRYLEFSGYDVFHVMNLTDVDDRTIKAAAAAGQRLEEHTAPFVQAFFEDLAYLRIKRAHAYPRATQSVPAMVRLVERLLDKGVAYRGEDGSVYFAIDRFPAYGRLSRLDRREIMVGARVASDEYAKDDPRDFALWKKADERDERVGAAWDAPFGRGRPGWHLECSAMSLEAVRRFGVETLDLHAGGVDLVFPHHEDEIAQSEAAAAGRARGRRAPPPRAPRGADRVGGCARESGDMGARRRPGRAARRRGAVRVRARGEPRAGPRAGRDRCGSGGRGGGGAPGVRPPHDRVRRLARAQVAVRGIRGVDRGTGRRAREGAKSQGLP